MTNRITIRLDADQFAALQVRAAALGLPWSAYICSLIAADTGVTSSKPLHGIAALSEEQRAAASAAGVAARWAKKRTAI
jgi:hypothetical protein